MRRPTRTSSCGQSARAAHCGATASGHGDLHGLRWHARLHIAPDEIDAGYAAAEEVLGRLPERLRKGIYGLPSGLDEFQVLQDLDNEDQ